MDNTQKQIFNQIVLISEAIGVSTNDYANARADNRYVNESYKELSELKLKRENLIKEFEKILKNTNN